MRHVFCVPGESYLPVLDALRDSPITVTVCRHEGGAAMMADAVGRATGRPGVAMVTRGPGASNAMVGVHIAHEDSSPMILFVGQVDEGFHDRGAWQEMDLRATFGGVSKWVGRAGPSGPGRRDGGARLLHRHVRAARPRGPRPAAQRARRQS